MQIGDDRTREPELLLDAVERRLQTGAHGFIWLRGPRGSGRTTALADLAQRMANRLRPYLCDGEVPRGIAMRSKEALVIATELPDEETRIRHETWTLAPWTRDDCIEYLLARYRDRVNDVLRRMEDLPAWCDLEGHAGLTARVLDELAADPELASAFEALEVLCEQATTRSHDAGLLERACLHRECGLASTTWDEIDVIRRQGFAHLVESTASRRLLAGRYVARCLATAQFPSLCERRFPGPLIAAVAHFASRDEGTLSGLIALAQHPATRVAVNAVEVLHVIAPARVREALVPRRHGPSEELDWSYSLLPGTDWSGSSIQWLKAEFADLTGAELARAILDSVGLKCATLARARLDGAILGEVTANGADFHGARARGISLEDCSFASAQLTRVDLTGADATRVQFCDVRFDRAVLSFAQFSNCRLQGATFTDADLSRASFVHCAIGDADLRTARLERTAFRFTDLRGSRLEDVHAAGLDFVHADLRQALLSGSRFPGANLRSANLGGAGLADVDWEGADLRDANFRHASFHLGSSRSGLLIGAPALWGSMTGFYDPEAVELAHQAPETIRKANLRHANLVGAHVEACDFYLVDLRGARYTAAQEAHFRACRAILDPRSLPS